MRNQLHALLCGLTVGACAHDAPTALIPPASALQAKGGGGSPGGTVLYKLRFISGVNAAGDGEIATDWFPAAGIAINDKNPWNSISLNPVTVNLVNSTHGNWAAGACANFIATFQLPVNKTNWDIAGTNPVLSFAGSWSGSLGVSGADLSFDGDRLVNGVLTPSAGGIHNVLSQQNVAAIDTKDATGNKDWYRHEVRNAYMKFGSASRPNGVSNPVGAEVACVNYTIEARKVSLIAP